MTIYNIKRMILDIIYPNKCPFCSKAIAYNQYYCCTGGFDLLDDSIGMTSITDMTALFEYNDKTSPFIYSIKDGGDGYAISAVAKLLSERIPESIDLITCIPTDSARMRERGYNPPALIALELSAITGIPCDPKLLVKTRRTEVQKSLSAAERQKNLKGVFGVRCPPTAKSILLIDDVCTTGATLSEAEKVLLSEGADNVCNVYTAVVAVVPEKI